jgi:ABC-type branched-subunit amino acid transport system substrate-binding protein
MYLADVAGASLDSIYLVAFWTPDSPDSVSRAFADRFRKLTGGEPTSAAAMSHDALMLTVRAIRDVGANPRAIRDYLLSLGKSRPPYRGVTGPITFLPDRPARLHMVRVSHGRVVPVQGPRDSI